jgi:hypothetical protein
MICVFCVAAVSMAAADQADALFLGKTMAKVKRAVDRVGFPVKITSLVRKHFEKELATLKTRVKPASLGRVKEDFKRHQKKLFKSAKEFLGSRKSIISSLKKSWRAFLRDKDNKALIQRILLLAAQKKIDAELRKDVAELRRKMGVDGPAGASPQPARSDGKHVTASDDRCRTGPPESQGFCHAIVGLQKIGYTAYSVYASVSGGAIVAGGASLGVVFDTKGQVAGVVSRMGGLGIVGKIEFDISFGLIQGDILGAQGGSVGVSGGAELVVGLEGELSWSPPFTPPIPQIGVGVTFPGIGVGVLAFISESLIFPCPKGTVEVEEVIESRGGKSTSRVCRPVDGDGGVSDGGTGAR